MKNIQDKHCLQENIVSLQGSAVCIFNSNNAFIIENILRNDTNNKLVKSTTNERANNNSFAAINLFDKDGNKKKGIDFLTKNKTNPSVKTTASGLQYEVLQEGDGKTKPKASDVVQVKYTGKLLDGTVFDSTDKNGGAPADINLGAVIKGWTEGLQLLKEGGKATFYIPAQLGYGEQGVPGMIPPNSTLIFDVELLEVK